MTRIKETLNCLENIYIIIFLLAGVYSVSAQQDSETVSPWEGKKIFQEKGCIHCHSIKGTGGDDAPDLGENKYYGTYLELASLMWNHVPDMIESIEDKGLEFPSLSGEETIQLLRYISYTRFWGESGNERVGRKILSEKKCIACHKFGGEGSNIGPDITKNDIYLSPLSLTTSMWNHLPEMMEMAAEKNIEQPKFKGDEIVDLASGIKSYMRPTKTPANQANIGNPVHGEKTISQAQCLHCHAINGSGGKAGPDFTEIDFNYSVTEIAGIMWNHGSVMYAMMKKEGMSFPKFNENDMADIIAFLYGLNMEDSAGDRQLGEKLVKNRGCLNCHKLAGQGGDLSIDLSIISGMKSPFDMISAMWNHAPAMKNKLLEENIDWPHLDQRDMANLYAYLTNITK